MQAVRKTAVHIILFLALFLISGNVFAADFYVAQTATGAADGSSCANALAYTWFNTAGNWANPKQAGKIGPGDTVHLCGTISGDGTGTNPILNFQGSGTAGSPITVLWESGATLSEPVGPKSGFVALNSNTDLIVDGGSNGSIQCTANGDGLAYSNNGVIGIYGSPSDITIRNLTIQNLYVHSQATSSNGSSAGIYFPSAGGNISISNNTVHDVCHSIVLGGGLANYTSLNIYSNNVYNDVWGIALGGPGLNNANIYSNIIGSTQNWYDNNDVFHADGIMIYPQSGSLTGVNVYNNKFTGKWSKHTTAMIFFDPASTVSMTKFNIYNNLLIADPQGGYTNGLICDSSQDQGFNYYNNTLIGTGISNNMGVGLSTGCTFKNNLLTGFGTFVNVKVLAAGGLDNNIYANAIASGNPPFFYNGTGVHTVSAWRTATGQDAQANAVSGVPNPCILDSNGFCINVTLNADGSLPAGCPAIGAGADLYSIFETDLLGNQRLQSGGWDIGAYAYEGGIAPPTNVHLGG